MMVHGEGYNISRSGVIGSEIDYLITLMTAPMVQVEALVILCMMAICKGILSDHMKQMLVPLCLRVERAFRSSIASRIHC